MRPRPRRFVEFAALLLSVVRTSVGRRFSSVSTETASLPSMAPMFSASNSASQLLCATTPCVLLQ
eukprot:7622988-Heterocapsa_arctica.AAC.1